MSRPPDGSRRSCDETDAGAAAAASRRQLQEKTTIAAESLIKGPTEEGQRALERAAARELSHLVPQGDEATIALEDGKPPRVTLKPAAAAG